MKNVLILLVIVLICIAQTAEAQTKKTTTKSKTTTTKKEEPPKKVQREEVMIEEAPPAIEDAGIDVEVVEEVKSYSSGAGGGNNRYSYDRIDEVYSTVRDKLSNEYKTGLSKNGVLILPIIFNGIETYGNLYRNEKMIKIGLGSQMGLFDLKTEKWHMPLIYGSLDYLENGLFQAKLNGLYGIIDKESKVISDFKWQYMTNSGVDNYYIVTTQQNQYGILNIITDKLTVPAEYSSLSKVENSANYLVTKGSKKNLITIDNQPVFKNWYEEIITNSSRRNMIVKRNGLFGIVDENENIILPIEYPFIRSYPYNDGSYLALNKEGKYGCVLIDGRVTLPFEYDKMDESYSGSLLSTKNQKCGIVQVNQGLPTEIVTCDFDEIKSDRNTFLISKNKKYGVLDNFGKSLVPLIYDHIEIVQDDDYYGRNMLFIATKDGNVEILNKSGQASSTSKYKSIKKVIRSDDEYYRKIGALKFIGANNKVGLLDLSGQEILPATYDDVLSVNANIVVYKLANKVGCYNFLSKKEIVKPEFDQIIFNKGTTYGIKGTDMYILNFSDPTKHTKI